MMAMTGRMMTLVIGETGGWRPMTVFGLSSFLFITAVFHFYCQTDTKWLNPKSAIEKTVKKGLIRYLALGTGRQST